MVADELQLERDLAAGFVCGTIDQNTAEAYAAQQSAADAALGTYTSAEDEFYDDTTELLREKLDNVHNDLATLGNLVRQSTKDR